jgi:hypothetical protein
MSVRQGGDDYFGLVVLVTTYQVNSWGRAATPVQSFFPVPGLDYEEAKRVTQEAALTAGKAQLVLYGLDGAQLVLYGTNESDVRYERQMADQLAREERERARAGQP